MSPDQLAFMNTDMRCLWNQMDPSDLEGYVLYGGTALAMYLNHRQSIDFDFFRIEKTVRQQEIAGWDWLQGASYRGKIGMVDVALPMKEREVRLNFVGLRAFNGIEPTQPSIEGTNGVQVAHPVDLVAAKLSALSSRKTTRDYLDVTEAFQRIPKEALEAADVYIADAFSLEHTSTELAKTLLAFPFEVEHALSESQIKGLSDFANALGRSKA